MAVGTTSGLTAGTGNDNTAGNLSATGAQGLAAGASGVNLGGGSGNVVSISSAAADAELYASTQAALASEQGTAQAAEKNAYDLAGLVSQSNPGVNAYSATAQMTRQNYEFIATSIFALAALGAWWIYRK